MICALRPLGRCVHFRAQEQIKGLTRLEELNVSANSFTDEGLGHLRAMTHVRVLVLAMVCRSANPKWVQSGDVI